MDTNTNGSTFFDSDCSFSEKSFQDLLEPIILPSNVSAESLAKIITAIILRKSYLCSSAWSKWILLAALDELLGKCAPLLSDKQLHELQGNQFEDSSAVTSSGIGFETEFEVSPLSQSRRRSVCRNVCDCSESISTASPFCSSCDVINEDQTSVRNFREEEKERKSIDEKLSSGHFNIKLKIQEDVMQDCTDTIVQTSETKTPEDLQFGKNCTSSATQTESCRLVDRAVLTDHVSLVDSATVTDHISLVESGTITDHVILVDRAILTDHDPLVCLMCRCSLEEHQTSYKNLSNVSTENKSTQTGIYRLVKISGLRKFRNKNLGRSKTFCKSGEKVIKIFHGKCLLGQKSIFQTPIIPLEPVEYYFGSDPRISSDHENQVSLIDLSDFAEQTVSTTSSASSCVDTHYREEFDSLVDTSVSKCFKNRRKRLRLDSNDVEAGNIPAPYYVIE